MIGIAIALLVASQQTLVTDDRYWRTPCDELLRLHTAADDHQVKKLRLVLVGSQDQLDAIEPAVQYLDMPGATEQSVAVPPYETWTFPLTDRDHILVAETKSSEISREYLESIRGKLCPILKRGGVVLHGWELTKGEEHIEGVFSSWAHK